VLLSVGCGSGGPRIAECISSWNAHVPSGQPYGHNLFGILGVSLESPHRCLLTYRDPDRKLHEFELREERFTSVPYDPHQKIRAKTATQISVDETGHLTKVGPAPPPT